MVTVQIEFLKDQDLLGLEKKKLASYYTNRGEVESVAVSMANAQVNRIQCTQVLTIREYPETAPISDIVSDIAMGRNFQFSVEPVN